MLARQLGHAAEFDAFIAEDAKRNLLAQVVERFGREGVIAAGRQVAAESAHPFVRALRAQSTPMQVLRVWMQLEVLAHAHNRVRVLDLRDDALRLLRTRLGAPDARPLIEEDLLILGVLQGFFSLLGLGAFTLCGPTIEARGHIWQLGFKRVAPLLEPAPPTGRIWCAEGEVERSVFVVAATLIAADTPVDLAAVARHLGLSTRSLQRRLTAAGTSFSTLLLAARVTMAGTSVVEENQTTLVDVAYRFGFADSAHMCHAFREVVGCSPSELMRAGRTPTGA